MFVYRESNVNFAPNAAFPECTGASPWAFSADHLPMDVAENWQLTTEGAFAALRVVKIAGRVKPATEMHSVFLRKASTNNSPDKQDDAPAKRFVKATTALMCFSAAGVPLL